MGAEELLRLLPDELLSEPALATGVNRYGKKLPGELIFKLLLHCILSYKDNSLRTMASAYESFAFKLLNPRQKAPISASALSVSGSRSSSLLTLSSSIPPARSATAIC